ncbi:hypothetical protein [Desulfallas thermosapovorans]|uniref:Uncharacterized protein n=1 Tax=Desulfallas thermosapovorans DSM 6562 TaxID=1121431 RepID=A0A5S4ZWK3_9FIRM|nr:hypothetical protein [Desulfallas thermosapovorans]TYO97387.1 hypothetical protein LX24_00581 [Desulfallas thermosapovorans DSM 6562]
MGFKDLEKKARDYEKPANAGRKELEEPQLTAVEEQENKNQ